MIWKIDDLIIYLRAKNIDPSKWHVCYIPLYRNYIPLPQWDLKQTTCQYSEQSLCPILLVWHNKIHFRFLRTKIWGLYLDLRLRVHQPLYYSSLGLTCVSCGSRLSTGFKKRLSLSIFYFCVHFKIYLQPGWICSKYRNI